MHRTTAILAKHQLRKTVVRERVLGLFLGQTEALGQARIEAEVGEIDRITLYRTLRTFEDAGIIHRAYDGSPNQKWALCHAHCTDHGHNDSHAHFHCTQCERTLCLDDVAVPPIKVPSGFVVSEAKVVLSGLCEACG